MEVMTRNGLYGFEFRDLDRRRSEDRKTWEIKQLWQRSHEIVNLAARGFKNVQIAEILNISPETVSNTLNSELGQHKLSEIRLERDEEAKKVSEKIRVITNKALKVYHEVFDNESGEVSLKDKAHFAEGFLKEMSGLRSPVKIQSHTVHTQLTTAEIEEFKKRGIEAARASGLITDVESESASAEQTRRPLQTQTQREQGQERRPFSDTNCDNESEGCGR
jgi:predicted transcriptional regulator